MNVPNARPTLTLYLELSIEHSLETRDTSFDGLRASQACRGITAHPHDRVRKDLISHIHEMRDALHDIINVAYLGSYDMELAKMFCTGADV